MKLSVLAASLTLAASPAFVEFVSVVDGHALPIDAASNKEPSGQRY
jgi:hypothetical protein